MKNDRESQDPCDDNTMTHCSECGEYVHRQFYIQCRGLCRTGPNREERCNRRVSTMNEDKNNGYCHDHRDQYTPNMYLPGDLNTIINEYNMDYVDAIDEGERSEDDEDKYQEINSSDLFSFEDWQEYDNESGSEDIPQPTQCVSCNDYYERYVRGKWYYGPDGSIYCQRCI